ncbi:type VI secretion system baseplate subunit TssF, partial [Enterobacter hormaechei]|uniref:type VI secretion system baseplate subunit TssF n=1 Tax=Enterobacter hormaechei TaxID=158836 RepID=UPI00263B8402
DATANSRINARLPYIFLLSRIAHYLVRGVQIEVTLDSNGFAGRGDICLFGEMLSRFFALYTDIYLFNRLIIILQPTGERLEWEEKHNRRIPG